MDTSLLHREVVPFILILAALVLATLAGDYALHALDLVWIGRYLGIPGSLLIVLSFGYSMRKRKLIRSGHPRTLLTVHEVFTLVGAAMVLVHAGVHFNAILPWLALAAMLLNVFSGLVGKFLLDRSRRYVAARRRDYGLQGLSKAETEKALFWDAVTFDLMAKWRAVHFPITLVFVVLSLGHILSILLFWNWR
ncbi:hypothetical protein EZJ19_06535 [Parasulfuritortus cantonensis]|uniref:Uncharacterized protein n=1 Tax=Parasulfuritortus cantonensis TaxID=2528202 RepID=A0A4R1BEL8_9PROT|nr:hypothetical protein [Parasulfuritortus cantonensis]TCJ15560.1 hypothetical protein EZJ19_06535 [Parasulfuritortus cantonensis]